jgi:hypothetical protein
MEERVREQANGVTISRKERREMGNNRQETLHIFMEWKKVDTPQTHN